MADRRRQKAPLNPAPLSTRKRLALGLAAFLQLMLQDAWPDRRVEVINLGTTAIASFPVLGITTEALDYEPDLVVVYTGHNEFFGTYGVASVAAPAAGRGCSRRTAGCTPSRSCRRCGKPGTATSQRRIARSWKR